MKPLTARMTYEQYYSLNDGKRYQLFDGELQEMTPGPTPRHQEILGELSTRLTAYAKKKSLGKIYIAPIDVVFEEHTVLQPDLIFVRQERLGIVGKRAVEGAPDLALEILTPSTFYDDLRRKMSIYQKFGVAEYWIVDPENRSIQVYRGKGSVLELVSTYSRTDIVKSATFPGMYMPLKDIF